MKYPIYSSKTVYPQDIQCVLEPRNGKGGIYIGNLEASENLRTLKKHGIKAILTAARDIDLNHPKSQIPYHLHIPGEDHERFDLKRYFDKSVDFIKNSLDHTNILVHCMAGISRSVTLVLAYLMKHHNLSYQQAFQSVRRKRRIINPNKGFIKQLQQFQKLLQHQAQAMRRSCDDFQARAKQDSLRKSYFRESSVKPSLHQSMKRALDASISRQNRSKYSTIGNVSQNIQRSDKNDIKNLKFDYRATNPLRVSNQGQRSFKNLNQQLDDKIASIRKKYMEATELLNREERKRTNKLNNANGFTLDQKSISYQDQIFKLPEPLGMKKTTSAIDQYRNSRINSTSYSYFNYNSRPTFKYFNY